VERHGDEKVPDLACDRAFWGFSVGECERVANQVRLQGAIKSACSMGIKNPNVYLWGHGHPGGLLIGNPEFPGFGGNPNDNNNTVESAN